VIHVPARDLGADEADGETPVPARKKPTRRGSRGGRNRRKKPAAATAAAEGAVATETPEPEPPSDNGAGAEHEPGEWEYTPMSEWGDD
jgi:hypothetical protein